MKYVNLTALEHIPSELRETGQFCVWKYEHRDGKMTKVPYNPKTGTYAMVNRAKTFSSYEKALETLKTETDGVPVYNGLGFRVSGSVGALDLDHCFAETEQRGIDEELRELFGDDALFDACRQEAGLKPWAADIVRTMDGCYMERSPSGIGLRILLSVPGFAFDKERYYINNRRLGLEVYVPGATKRFVTLTGDVFREGGLPDKSRELQTILDQYMKRPTVETAHEPMEPHSYLQDDEVIAKASACASGVKFRALYAGDLTGYDSPSNADMALCAYLAFWCGCDEEQMDRLFRSSGLYREKWDRPQSGSTYGALTIQKVIRHCHDCYNPVGHLVPPEDEFQKLLDDGYSAFGEDASLTEEEKRSLAQTIRLVDMDLQQMKPHSNPRYSWSEMGMGRLFADYYRRVTRFVPERRHWYVFNGKVWKHDQGGLLVMQLAKHLVDELLRYSLTIERDVERADYIAFISKMQTRRKRQIMVDDAQDENFASIQVFDRNRYLFNCQNGTLDLSTMEFHAHRPEDMLTMLAGVTYSPDAVCERWNTFITEVMVGDAELADFLQRALGYTLTGDTSLECMFILYGATSRNGKGTTMETFLKIMGDYGKTSNPEMLSAKFGASNNGGPSEEVARLAGARFVNISEPEKRISFHAALVKRLTGNDTINARYLHENSFDFSPMFKIFINTNYLPNVSDMTLFDSGRLKIIPFKRHFSEAEQDKGLKHLFAEPEALSGILNWCLEGCRKFKKYGLEAPPAVLEATGAYRRESDRIGQFIEAWLEPGEGYEVRSAAAYRVYCHWCAENGFNPENAKNFNRAIATHFELAKKRPKDGGGATTMLVGCRLRAEEDGIIPEN